MWLSEVTWQTKDFISPLALDQWPPNILGADLTRGTSTYKFAWGHVTKKNITSRLSQCLWSQLIREVSYCEELPRITLNEEVSEVTYQIKYIVSPLSQDLLPLNLTGCWLTGEVSAWERLSRHCLLVGFGYNAKSLAVTALFFLLLVSVFGWIDKNCLRIFVLFLLSTYVTNFGFVIIICHVFSSDVF